MDLIEQLGGHEKTKKKLKMFYLLRTETMVDAVGNIFDRSQLEAALLQYRRQHNIFEVGDYILTNDDASDGKVYEIEKNHFNEHFKIRSKDGFRYCRYWRIDRHATDEEIKAGKRLEVNQ